MAEKGSAKVTIKVDDKGSIKATKKGMDGLASATSKVTVANKGVAGTSGKAGKDFSRMASGMGGLVAAYATVAANVFALSAAFTVLKNSADFDSMIISSKNLEAATGASLTKIAGRLQKATGAQISFAAAVAATNKAMASGIDSSSLEKFTTLATKAAQTFGGSTTDALNRMIDAVLRGRTELVNKLGIVISADEAYDNFASSIGKSVKELTSFERRLAITNIIIEKGNEALGDTVIDPNPFEVLASTFLDLGQSILSFGTATDGVLTKLLSTFNQSAGAVAAFAGILVASVIKKILPTQLDLENKLDNSVKRAAARASAANALQDQQVAALKIAEKKKTATIQEENNKRVRIIAARLEKETDLELAKSAKVPKSIQKIITSGPSSLTPRQQQGALNSLNQNISGNAKNLTKDAKISRRELLKLRTALKISMGLNDTWREKIIVNSKGISTAFQKMKNKVVNNLKAKGAALSKFRADYDSTRLHILKNGMGSAFAKGNKGIKSSLGVISGGFNAILGKLHIILFVIGAGIAFWNKYGDALTGVNSKLRDLNNNTTKSKLILDDYFKNLKTGKNTAEDFATKGLKGMADQYVFIGNAISEVTAPLTNFFNLQATLLKESKKELADYTSELKNTKSEIDELLERGGFWATFAAGGKAAAAGLGFILDIGAGLGTPSEIKERLRQQGVELAEASFEGVSSALSTNIQKIEKRLGDASVDILFNEFNNRIGVASKKSANLAKAFNDFVTKNGFVTSNNISDFFGGLNESLSNEDAVTVGKLLAGILSDSGSAVTTQGKNLGSLLDTIRDSVKSVSSQNLEIVNSSSLSKQIKILEKAKNQILTFAGTAPQMKVLATELSKVFDLGDVSTFDEARDKIEEIFNIIDKANNNIAVKNSLKASLEGQKASLKVSLILATTDADRMATLIKLNAINVSSLNAEKSILQSKIIQADKATVLNELSKSQLAILNNEADLARARLDTINKELSMEERKLAIRKESFRLLIGESKDKSVELKQQNSILSASLKVLDINVGTAAQQKRDIQDKIVINKLLDSAQKIELKRKEIIGQQDPIIRAGLERQLKVLENSKERLLTEQQITEELRKRDHKTNTAILAANNRPFEAAGQAIIGEAEEAQKIADNSIQKLVTGFATGVRAGVGTLVDSIIDGDFKLIDALAAMGESLLDTISEVATDQITNALMSAFGIETLEKESLAQLKIIAENSGKTQEELGKKTIKAEPESVFSQIVGSIKSFIGFGEAKEEPLSKFSQQATATVDGLITGESPESPTAARGLGTEAMTKDRTAGPIITEMKAKEERAVARAAEKVAAEADGKARILELLESMSADLIDIAFNTANAGTEAIPSPLKDKGKGKDPMAKAADGAAAASDKGSKATDNNSKVTASLGKGLGVATEGIGALTDGAAMLGIDVGENSIVGRLNTVATLANTIQLMVSGITSSFAANGGVISNKGFTPLANGGIATQAQNYVIGEGRKNEAVVPLPNNKEIPVVMKGGGGGAEVTTNNYDFSNADPATETRIRALIEQNGKDTFGRVFGEMDRGGIYSKKAGRRR